MEPASDFAHEQMRNWKVARNATAGWSVQWNVDDRNKFLPAEEAKDLHVRYTDFTSGADAYLGEAWVVAGTYYSPAESWVPRVMVRQGPSRCGRRL